jgi:hypothetical protein
MAKGRVPEHLKRAADIIDERGWTQHIAFYDGAVDVTGAVALSFGVPEKHLSNSMDDMSYYAPANKVGFLLTAWEFLEGYLRAYPSHWNDQKGRTKEEVTRALRNAAAELDVTV